MKHIPSAIDKYFLAAKIYGILRLAQKRGKLVSHTDLAMVLDESSDDSSFANALDMVMEWCMDTEYELLPSIVTKRELGRGIWPGTRYFDKARALGYETTSGFWQETLKKLGYTFTKVDELEFM